MRVYKFDLSAESECSINLLRPKFWIDWQCTTMTDYTDWSLNIAPFISRLLDAHSFAVDKCTNALLGSVEFDSRTKIGKS